MEHQLKLSVLQEQKKKTRAGLESFLSQLFPPLTDIHSKNSNLTWPLCYLIRTWCVDERKLSADTRSLKFTLVISAFKASALAFCSEHYWIFEIPSTKVHCQWL